MELSEGVCAVLPPLTYEVLSELIAVSLKSSRELESKSVALSRYLVPRSQRHEEGEPSLADKLADFHTELRGGRGRVSNASHASSFRVTPKVAAGAESLMQEQMERARRSATNIWNTARPVVSSHRPRPPGTALPGLRLLSLPRPRVVRVVGRQQKDPAPALPSLEKPCSAAAFP